MLVPFWRTMTWLRASPGRLLAAMGLLLDGRYRRILRRTCLRQAQAGTSDQSGQDLGRGDQALAAVMVYGIVIAASRLRTQASCWQG